MAQMTQISEFLRLFAVTTGWLVLLLATAAAIRARLRPASIEDSGARLWLSWPLLALQIVLFYLGGWLLWRPLPLVFSTELEVLLVLIASPIYYGGLALYLWGMSSLGESFAPSSARGVRLPIGQELITRGPYQYVRHPMYLGLIMGAMGASLIFRTWAILFAAIFSLRLVARAHREEAMLARQFDAEWEAYATRTPAWLPHFRSDD